jgi:hypothetical protein
LCEEKSGNPDTDHKRQFVLEATKVMKAAVRANQFMAMIHLHETNIFLCLLFFSSDPSS